MSSDEYFDELDTAFLEEVDAIEAAHVKPQRPPSVQKLTAVLSVPSAVPTKRTPPSEVIEVEDSDDFESFDFDDEGLQLIDKLCDSALRNQAPVAGPSGSTFARTASKATIQTTLFGGIVTESPAKASAHPRQPMQCRDSEANNGFVGNPRKIKKWDHTAFAKTGWKKPPSVKGKERATDIFDQHEEEEEEPEEFEQFPAPFVSLGPPAPAKLQADRLAARHWIYPLNQQRRDYQFNIVKRCLFENTLVALPTGLGKTFIAGVVMLNFYTWFPEGKVVFVAPTKPLVAQQIEACHKTCGIPGSHAAELTGHNPRAMRAKAWREKRVFYMTPQTLMNDLRTENCDPGDIVLLVIDEAHKGTGDYAYAQVVRYMMAKNPHFRVLALTATPGSKPDAVQAIVDSLHVSHIEIRDEQSLDLAPYLHKKHIEQHVITMTDDIAKVRDLLSEVMTPMIQKLYNAKLLYGNPRPVALHPFSCTKALGALHAGNRAHNQWAFPMLSKLSSLARAMGYLIEGSLSLCYTSLIEISSGVNAATGKQTSSKSKVDQFQKDPKLQAVIHELETQKNHPAGFSVHPKMDKMRTLLVEHFAQKKFDKDDAVANGGGQDLTGDSRVMVFVSYRQCIEEVMEILNQEKPLIRAVPFIGQGTDKNGKKGYGQKEQLEIIKRFKIGEFNVLVSTSIGEEGLDIGEIDMIICYDAQKTPIRMLQRIGRTGRKRDGYVHVLLSKDREERNWDKADDNYKDVQRFIIKAEHLELYGDVERLIPDHIKPSCVEMVMEIEEYTREDPSAKKTPKSPTAKAPKRVRNDDIMRNIPPGASTTFVNVKDLLRAGTKKRKKVVEKTFDELGQDDEVDLEIAAGLSRRTTSMPEPSAKRQKKLRQSATLPRVPEVAQPHKKQTRKKGVSQAASFDTLAQDDSGDEEITKGLSRVYSKPKPAVETQSRVSRKPSVARTAARATSTSLPASSPVVISSSPEPSESRDGSVVASESWNTPAASSSTSSHTHSLANGDVLDLATPVRKRLPQELRWPSPELPVATTSRQPSSPVGSPIIPAEQPSEAPNNSMAWLLDDDDDMEIPLVGSSPLSRRLREQQIKRANDSDVEVLDDKASSPSPSPSQKTPGASCSYSHMPNCAVPASSQLAMPPPALPMTSKTPARSPLSRDPDELSSPALTFAVRGPSKGVKKRLRIDSSSPLVAPPTPQRRIRRQSSRDLDDIATSSPPKKRKKRKFADIVEAQKHNPWIDVEASQSGEEMSQGGSDDDALSESDRQFIAEGDGTQASPSYDQSAVYRRSLMTQAPAGTVPRFAKGPVRRGVAAFAGPSRPRERAVLSSSPPRDSDPDEYVFGSFVVDDDADISYVDDA